MSEEKKEKPFYKTKEFWLEVAKIATQAAVLYLASRERKK